jgi:hypothetical protein
MVRAVVTTNDRGRPMRRRLIAVCGALALGALPAAACGSDGDDSGGGGEPAGGGRSGAGDARLDPARYSAKVDHPLMPLSKVRFKVLQGSEGNTKIRVEERVLDRTRKVAGVPVAIVDVMEYENGELVEHTLDCFSQRRDGSVFYMGEHVDDYKDGKIVGHGGQWLAGKNGAKPGLFMPAEPKVGQRFEQERAPGVAEDRSTVVALGRRVTTAAGSFEDCIKTRDFAPLDNQTEFKFYCRGPGLVREQAPETKVDLIRYR